MIVYRHRRLDNYEVFYVGIAKSKRRPYSKFSRNLFWKNVVAKAGYEVEIISILENWKDCCELEQLLISEYGRADLGTGPLVNLTNGGEGIVGRIVSEKERQRMKIAFKGRKHSEEAKIKIGLASIGRLVSDETKVKLSLARKGKPLSEEHKEKLRLSKQNISDETKVRMKAAKQNISDETRLKMSIAKKGKTSNRKGVKLSEETIAKLRIARLSMSDETKLKMSIAKKKYWENKQKTYETN
jgi:hypothetical protein